MSDFPASPLMLHSFSTYHAEAAGCDSIFHTQTTPTSSAWPVANKALFVPFALRTTFPIKRFWWLNGATAAGSVDVAIYTMGGARLLSVGGVAQSGTNVIQSSAPTAGPPWTLAPGAYYLAIAASLATTTFFTNAGGSMNLSEAKMMGFAEQTTAYPLPDPATLASISTTPCAVPVFGFVDYATI